MDAGAHGLNAGKFAVKGRGAFQQPAPLRGIELQPRERSQRLDGRLLREIVYGLFDGETLVQALLGGQSFVGGLVGAVRGQPQGVAQRKGVVVHGHGRGFAAPGFVIAVQMIVADPHDHAREPEPRSPLVLRRAEFGLELIVVRVHHAVLDVEGRGNILHFELGFGPLQLFEHCLQNGVGGCGGRSCRGGRVRRRNGNRAGRGTTQRARDKPRSEEHAEQRKD